MLAAAGTDSEGSTLYQQHWSASDPWAYSPKQAQLVQGSVSVGDRLTAHSEVRRTAFYSDYGRHYDVVRLIGGIIETGALTTSVLSVTRGEHQQPFGEDEVALFGVLVPHLQRALQLHRRLTTAEGTAEDLASVIDTSSRGVLLID